MEVGRSQSFLPLRRGRFAGKPARTSFHKGRSPDDSGPKAFYFVLGVTVGQLLLALEQLVAEYGQRRGDLHQVSKVMDKEMKGLTGRHGLF
jgi:hypothetical protein